MSSLCSQIHRFLYALGCFTFSTIITLGLMSCMKVPIVVQTIQEFTELIVQHQNQWIPVIREGTEYLMEWCKVHHVSTVYGLFVAVYVLLASIQFIQLHFWILGMMIGTIYAGVQCIVKAVILRPFRTGMKQQHESHLPSSQSSQSSNHHRGWNKFSK